LCSVGAQVLIAATDSSPAVVHSSAEQQELTGGVRARLSERRLKRRQPPWRELAQCLFFIVEAIDDYLYTNEHRPDGSVRTIYSGPNRAKLMGGEPPPETSPAAEWVRMIHPDDRASYEAHSARLSRGRPSEVLYRLQGYDGVTRWLHGTARPRDSDGRVFVDGIMSDVTRRVEAETALAEVEHDLRRQLKLNEYQACHDHLTGLGNRRLLVADLETLSTEATRDNPLMLVVLDLDGFKRYNDVFGHPAGDALLARLGKKLAAAAGPASSCYRLGGDEFCVLHRGRGETGAMLEAASGALAERGEGFTIGCSFGAVSMPEETSEPEEALQIADQRLYALKRAQAGPRDATHDALLQALYERAPDLRNHTTTVARLAQATGARLGLGADALEHVRQAALLHDIGKIAVPDSILEKPGPLTPDERASIELHTVVGERILAASPALRPVARIVRSHHERWDGAGYPDKLVADETPIEARIIAACDVFSAFTSCRSYRDARSPSETLEEIRRRSATQFDPAVVDALAAVLADLGQTGLAHAERRAS